MRQQKDERQPAPLRPAVVTLALFMGAYIAGAGLAHWLAVRPSTGISTWPPGGLLVATLALAPRRSAAWWIAAAGVADGVANWLWFANSALLASLLFAGNALCALFGATLLRNQAGEPIRLATPRDVGRLGLAASLAPAISAAMGSMALAALQGQDLGGAWWSWWLGDATGILCFAPIVFVATQSWGERKRLNPWRAVEAIAIAAVLVVAAVLSLSGRLPFAYIVVPPLLWAAVRFEIRGAVLAEVLLAFVAAVFTVQGVSPFSGDSGSPDKRFVMLQLFLGISAVSGLLVASIARQSRLAREQLHLHNDELEARVEQRTQQLQRSEEQLRLALRAGTMGVWRWNPATGASEVDDTLKAMAGLTGGESGADWASEFRSHIDPDDRPALDAQIERAMAEGGQYDHEFRYLHPDGRKLWLAGFGMAIRDEYGAFQYLTGVNFDVTARRKVEEALRESRAQLQMLADNTPDLIARFDRQLRHVFVNIAVERATGRAREEFIGKTNRELGMPENRCDEWDRALHATFDSGAAQTVRFQMNGPAGTRHYEGRLVPERGRGGDVEHVLVITSDETHRVEAQRAVEDADRRKDEFLATLAHELRNPLAPVRNAVHVMQREGLGGPTLAWSVEVIERQVQAMTRLIDDLLDVTRINEGKMELRRQGVALDAVVHLAVESSQPLIDAMRHRLNIVMPPEPVLVHVDKVRLAQVLLNLLNNAAKYTERGGRIDVTVEQSGLDIVMSVRDTGIGIAPDQLAAVFGMFSQVTTSASWSQGGLGIGLSLAKRLVEMHGGSIEAKSEGPGRGSEFIVSLPGIVVTATAPAASAIDDTDMRASSLRVLVVDDNQDASETLATLLELSGHIPCIANDGEEALAVASSFQPDVVLCDIGLPGLNGYDVCRQLKAVVSGRRTCVIAVTGWAQDKDKQKALEAGFDHHVVKPVEPLSLLGLLGRFGATKS